MAQRQCPGCNRLGARVAEADLRSEEAHPHADGSSCVCRHVTASSKQEARRHGGRWFDGSRWVCEGGCYNAPFVAGPERATEGW
jgi:hypothetical protein